MTTPKSSLKQLVLASHNVGKIAELSALLSPADIEVLSLSDFTYVEAEETGTTFIENAIIKARYAAKVSGLPALADDSGLVVSELGGEPGIYSARYAQQQPDEPKSDTKNNTKLLAAMQGKTDRRAMFVCIMALCLSDTHPLPIIAQGQWHGEIADTPHGDSGFGYDPLFFVPSHGVTAAELDKAEKNRISHRGLALQSLLLQLDI